MFDSLTDPDTVLLVTGLLKAFGSFDKILDFSKASPHHPRGCDTRITESFPAPAQRQCKRPPGTLYGRDTESAPPPDDALHQRSFLLGLAT